MANATRKLNFYIYFMLIRLNSHMVATMIDSALPDLTTGLKEIEAHVKVKGYHADKIS